MPLSAKHCCLAVAIALSFATLPAPALAQSSATRHELSLPAQPLGDALIALGKAAHVSIAFEPSAVAGLRAPVLQGNYTPGEALQQLLKSSGLSARQTADNSYAIEASPATSAKGAGNAQADEAKASGGDAKMLDTVRVTATVKGFSATRMPTALKDVPQSISIIDQQTLREQNATEVAEAFKWAPGITLQKNGAENSRFFSRGFSIDTIHIDGGGPLDYVIAGGQAGQLQRIDLSEYEQIEVLRGADALFGGVGDPGGSINLARKRPLAENAASVAASAGSWDHYRVEADLSGKLSGDGRLRGRMVAVDESQHYFYKTAQRRMNKLYAVTEYDLLPDTRVTLGGSYERTPDYVQNQNGVPRYVDGRDAHLPRSTALTFPWAKSSATKKESFLQLEHAFSDRWKLKTGVTRTEQVQSVMYVNTSDINPVTKTVAPTYITSGSLDEQQTTWDLSLLGGFDWNGRKQEVVLGADAAQQDQSMDSTSRLLQGPPINLFRFDPGAYTAPTNDLLRSAINIRSRERGVFASIKLRPADGWAITAGARSNFNRADRTSSLSFGTFQRPPSTTSTSDSGVITPFLGAVYELSPMYSLYASYADTTAGASRAMTASGKLLGQQRGTNKEFGLKGASRDGWLNGSVALFDIRKINVIASDPTVARSPIANCCYIPTTQRSKGFEAELNGRLAPGWQLSGGYTLNINHAGDGSTLSTVTPKHLLKLWTNYRLPGPAGPWEIGGGVIAQSKNYSKGFTCPAFDLLSGACTSALVPFRAQQGFYTVATLRAGYRLNEHWNLALNIDNLFDRRYYATVSGTAGRNFYGEPRNWMLTLRGEY